MWNSTSSLDHFDDRDVPVHQLRKPPSQRGAGSPPPPPPLYQQDDSGAEGVQPANLDGFGWAAIWWFIGFLAYGGAGFKFWLIVTAVLVLASPVYMIGAGLVLACIGFMLFK